MARLTMRLHQLVQNWPLLRNVVEVSLPDMHRLAERIGQSCHLGVYNAGRMHVAAQVESPKSVGLRVRVGVDYSLLETIRTRGYELSDSDILQGVTDISFPVLDSQDNALAALTVPYLSPLKGRKNLDSVIGLVRRHAAAISRRMMSET